MHPNLETSVYVYTQQNDCSITLTMKVSFLYHPHPLSTVPLGKALGMLLSSYKTHHLSVDLTPNKSMKGSFLNYLLRNCYRKTGQEPNSTLRVWSTLYSPLRA